MTYQEYYEKLHKDYSQTSETFLKIDRELGKTKGFGNLLDVPDYIIAKSNWQAATNNYWGFLSYIKGKNINPDQEIDLS